MTEDWSRPLTDIADTLKRVFGVEVVYATMDIAKTREQAYLVLESSLETRFDDKLGKFSSGGNNLVYSLANHPDLVVRRPRGERVVSIRTVLREVFIQENLHKVWGGAVPKVRQVWLAPYRQPHFPKPNRPRNPTHDLIGIAVCVVMQRLELCSDSALFQCAYLRNKEGSTDRDTVFTRYTYSMLYAAAQILGFGFHHGDVQPQNILPAHDGVKIIDFDLATCKYAGSPNMPFVRECQEQDIGNNLSYQFVAPEIVHLFSWKADTRKIGIMRFHMLLYVTQNVAAHFKKDVDPMVLNILNLHRMPFFPLGGKHDWNQKAKDHLNLAYQQFYHGKANNGAVSKSVGFPQELYIYAASVVVGILNTLDSDPLTKANRRRNATSYPDNDEVFAEMLNVMSKSPMLRVLLKCLHIDPRKRYQSVQELDADLRNAHSNAPALTSWTQQSHIVPDSFVADSGDVQQYETFMKDEHAYLTPALSVGTQTRSAVASVRGLPTAPPAPAPAQGRPRTPMPDGAPEDAFSPPRQLRQRPIPKTPTTKTAKAKRPKTPTMPAPASAPTEPERVEPAPADFVNAFDLPTEMQTDQPLAPRTLPLLHRTRALPTPIEPEMLPTEMQSDPPPLAPRAPPMLHRTNDIQLEALINARSRSGSPAAKRRPPPSPPSHLPAPPPPAAPPTHQIPSPNTNLINQTIERLRKMLEARKAAKT